MKGEKIRIKKAKNVDEIFDILDPYWSYVDYDLLEHIIKVFGTSDLQEEMRKYIAELEQFEKKTTVHDFSLAIQEEVVIPAHFGKLAVKLKKDSKSFTLHDVRQFKKSVENESSLKEYTLLFRGRSSNSVKIIFAFPPEAHAKLLEVFKDKQFRKKHKVMSEEFSTVQDVECKEVGEETHSRPTRSRKHAVKSRSMPILNKECPYLEYKEMMSSSENLVSFRRFVSDFASKLDATEANQIAYIQTGSTKNSSDGAFFLLLKLECENVFSFENPSGLIEIAKDVGREDLVQSVEEYIDEFEKIWKDMVTREERLPLLSRFVGESSVSSSESSECSARPEPSSLCE